jgi:uncharacterized protein (TIGR02217 family)
MSTAVFPSLKGIIFPVKRSPMFDTLIQASAAGQEYRAQLEAYPRWKWEIGFDWLRTDTADLQTLLSFYLARNGMYDAFLWTDPDDYAVTTPQQIGIGNGTTAAFQLIRPMGAGGFLEPILAPNTVTAVYVNGVLQVNGTAYGVGDWENGVSGNGTINFFSGYIPSSGAVVAAMFTYYWPVRFLADSYEFSKFMANPSRYELQKLDFISVKNSS